MSSQSNFIPTMIDGSSSAAHALEEANVFMMNSLLEQDSHMNMLVNNQGPHLNMFGQQNQHLNVFPTPTRIEGAIGENNVMSRNENRYQEAAREFYRDENRYQETDAESYRDEEGEEEEDEEDDGYQDPARRKKTYHRHTPEQIQELENSFSECHRPNERQRRHLSHKLGLDLMQVKFWFQNRRTQMKTQMERDKHTQIKRDNEKLARENGRYKRIISNVACPDCGGHGIQAEIARRLQAENEFLRPEVGRVANNEASGSRNIASSSREQPPLRMPVGEVNNNLFSNQMIRSPAEVTTHEQAGIIPFASGALIPIDYLHQHQKEQELQLQLAQRNFKIDKNMVWNMALGAMEEIEKLSQMGEPMWIPDNSDSNSQQLNHEEYLKANFPLEFGPRPANLHWEATRHSTIIAMSSVSLIDIFLNLNHFKSVFNAIVAKTMTLGVVSTGTTGSFSGTLHVISTELQMLCQLVPVRQNILARYCRQLGEGRWGVADVSVDIFRPDHLLKCRKRPSGCIIEDLPNGFSRVTWIEHVEVQELGVHPMFRPLVVSGYAFGAKRWLGILERQTDRLVSILSQSLPYNDIVVTNMGSKRIMTQLAERMVANYNGGVSTAAEVPWGTVEHSGPTEMKILILRNLDHPGRPIGVVLSTTFSFWLPALPMNVFKYLLTLETRHEWDVLTGGGRVEEISRIVIGRDNANCVSLLRINETKMLILQEANWDPMGAYLIYAPVDVNAVNLVMGASGDSDYVALLPSGFVVFPDGPSDGSSSSTDGGGSVVTLSYQLLVDSSPVAENLNESFLTVTNLITNTIHGLVTYFNNRRRDALSLV